MADIGTFIEAVLWNWWTVLAGFMIAVEPVTRFLWRGYDAWAAKRLSPSRRRKLARAAALGAFIIANYMAFHAAKEETRAARGVVTDTARHLTPDKKARLAAALQLGSDKNYSIEFNSVQNCDECEDYAQELRDFVGSIPGWKASGSVITFADPYAPRTGLQLVLGDKASPEVGKRLLAAFGAASIALTPRPSEQLQGLDAIIVVARQPK